MFYGFRFANVGFPPLFAAVVTAPLAVVALGVALAWSAPRRSALSRAASAGLLVTVVVAIAVRGATAIDCGDGVSGQAGQQVLMYSHNVRFGHGRVDREAEQIRAVDADVIVLQEADADFVRRLSEHLGPEAYPYVAQAASEQTLSLAILSRFPLVDIVDTTTTKVDTNPTLATTIDSPIGLLKLVNVHLSAPINGIDIKRWNAEYDELIAAGPQTDVLVGDFNSTRAHRRFRQLVDQGYRDAHKEAGCGLVATWSPRRFGPSLFHLDHVLVASNIHVVRAGTLDRAGSDHRAVIAVLTAARAARFAR